MDYKIRGRIAGDIEFITSSMLNYYKQYSVFGKSLAKDVFMKNHSLQLNKVLKNAKLVVACDPEMPSNILGYIIAEKNSGLDLVHFAFVKKDLRGKGIATRLMASVKTSNRKCIYTHQTSEKKNFLDKFYEETIYSPYRFLDGVYYA